MGENLTGAALQISSMFWIDQGSNYLALIILSLAVSQVLRTSSVKIEHSSIRLKIFLASSRYDAAVSRMKAIALCTSAVIASHFCAARH